MFKKYTSVIPALSGDLAKLQKIPAQGGDDNHKGLLPFIFAFIIMISSTAIASQGASPSPTADKLFQMIVMDPTLNSRIKQDVNTALNHLAKKLPCATEMQPAIAKISSNFVDVKMRPLATQLLSQEFSEAELKDIANFLSSPTGKKIIAKTPEISDRVNQIIVQAAIQNSAEITNVLTHSMNSDGTCKVAQ